MFAWAFAAVFAGIIIAWLVAFCIDPEAFNSGAKR